MDGAERYPSHSWVPVIRHRQQSPQGEKFSVTFTLSPLLWRGFICFFIHLTSDQRHCVEPCTLHTVCLFFVSIQYPMESSRKTLLVDTLAHFCWDRSSNYAVRIL